MSKIIVCDLGSLTFQAIFGSYSQQKLRNKGKISQESFIMPSNYLFFMSLISLLRRVGVSKEDSVLLVGDGKNSWRKIFDKNYKAQREDFRKKFEINWQKEYSLISKTINDIDQSTDFHIIWLNSLFNGLDLINTPEGEKYLNVDEIDLLTEYSVEADDIAGVCCKVFKDKKIVLITKDLDWSTLCVNPNVKFFSMNTKYKGGTGVYKQIDNGYKVLEKKIRLGDVSDNILVDKENDTERDKEIRKLIIDLINLPEWVSRPIENVLRNLPQKICDFSKLPFQNSLAKRFPSIYSPEKIITYDECIKRLERKELIAKNKKLRLKKEKTLRKVDK
jgi:hypothetical protein